MELRFQPGAVSKRMAAVRFSRTVVTDIGASHQGGSLKMRIYSHQGHLEKELKGTVAEKPIQDSADFVKQYAAQIKKALQGLPTNDKIDTIAIFAPGQAKMGQYGLMANIRTKKGDPLREVDFNDVWKFLGQSVAKPNQRKLLAANDMFGVGSGFLQLLKEHPAYSTFLEKNGFSATICMTGGGCGVIRLRRVGNTLQLEGSESGHIRGQKNPIEQEGASATALIQNFAEGLKNPRPGLFPSQKTLSSIGLAQVVTQYELPVEKNGQTHQDLMATGLFREKAVSGSNQVALTLTGVSKTGHRERAFNAIERYMEAVSQLCQIEVTKGVNAFFLTGPLVGGLKQFLEDNREAAVKRFDLSPTTLTSHPTIFDALINTLTQRRMDGACQDMVKNISGFRILTDIEVSDNTIGGQLFSQSQPTDYPNIYQLPALSTQQQQATASRNGQGTSHTNRRATRPL